jgi:hypothetical protein
MRCVGCGSAAVSERRERTVQGYRRFRCRVCGKQFNERSGGLLNRTQFPSDVIALVVLWRLRYKLSLRDLSEMFLLRGIVFSYEAVRDWEAKLTPVLAETLRRRRRGKVGRSWYTDETYLKVQGRWVYLYRAIDRAGVLVDVMLSETRDMKAAKRSSAPPRPSPPSRRHGLRPTAMTATRARSAASWAGTCGTGPAVISTTGWSKTTAASKADTGRCAGSSAPNRQPGSVEATTSSATFSVPVLPITSPSLSTTAASTSSAPLPQ